METHIWKMHIYELLLIWFIVILNQTLYVFIKIMFV